MRRGEVFTRTTGSGPDLVLLHGWGMNGDVWDGVMPALAGGHRVTVVDLPGHGRSGSPSGDPSLSAQAADIAGVLPARFVLAGWSLGGLLALQLQLDFPERVAALALVASSPRFVRGDDWPDAMQAEVLAGFAAELQDDYRRTINRFLAIQALGSEHAREELRLLRERVFAHGEPDPEALAAGLAILDQADLRPRLGEVKCPVLIVAGERDTLFPLPAARRSEALLPDAHLAVVEGAGHAPFLSHPQEFANVLRPFLSNLK